MDPRRIAGGALVNTHTKRILQSRWLAWGLRILLAGVFLYAGIEKLGSPQLFADSIATFRLLPDVLINPLALGLPFFEITIGGLLFSGRWFRVAALGAVAMTAVFIIAFASASVRGISVDCGCFGSNHAKSREQIFIALERDVLLSAAALVLYWQANQPKDG